MRLTTEPQNPTPDSAEGKPPVGEAEGAAHDHIDPHNEGDTTERAITGEQQNPADEMHGGPDEAGDEEVDEEISGFWLQLKKDPFAVILSIATAVLAIATVVLAGSTVGLWLATRDLRDYAEKQTGDMKTTLNAAQDAATAMGATANALADLVEAVKKGVDINKTSVDRQRASERAFVSIEGGEITGFDTWSATTIGARVMLKNTGPAQANAVKTTSKLIVAAPTATPCTVNFNGTLERTLAPNGGESSFFARADAQITPDQKQAVLNGKMAIFVYGRVIYGDTQGRHYQEFRLAYRGDGSQPRDSVLRLVQTGGCNDGK
jgi:hypothetical protein